MAKLLNFFGKGRNSQNISQQKDTQIISRVILGNLKHCEPQYRRLFELGLPHNAAESGFLFPALEPPLPQSKIRFEGQTFPQWKIQKDFQRLSFKQRKRLKRKKLYVLPIGPFPDFVLAKICGLDFSLFELLCEFVSTFYIGFEVLLKDVVNLDELSCTTRIHAGTGKRQILVKDVISYLRQSLPKDGFSIIAVTWEDMYPGDEWNFILGEASSVDGCAAMSFGHYEPKESQRTYNQNSEMHSRTSDQVANKSEKDMKSNSNCESFVQNIASRTCGSDKNDSDEKRSRTNDQICYEDGEKSHSKCESCAENIASVSRTCEENNGDGDNKHSRTNNQLCIEDGEKSHSKCESCAENIASVSRTCGNDKENSNENHPKMIDQGKEDEVTVNEKDGRDRINNIDAYQIWKFFRVISHELGHLFGLTHCVYFSCAMNESTTVHEAINQPLFMCPICLKKIQTAAGFDIKERYHKLKIFLVIVYRGLLEEEGKRDKCGANLETLTKDSSVVQDSLEKFSCAISWLESVLEFLEIDNDI